jgi:hypothetical protein
VNVTRVAAVAAASATAIPMSVALTATPASADNDAVCLGDYNGYRVQFAEPMRLHSSPSNTYGHAVLFYHPTKRCVYGKVSLPSPLVSNTVGDGQLTKITPDGARFSDCYIEIGSSYCLTEKFYDAGFSARMLGYYSSPYGSFSAYTPWW